SYVSAEARITTSESLLVGHTRFSPFAGRGLDLVAQHKGILCPSARAMSQIAFFTRDGDMRDRRSRISRPKSGALIRATNLRLTPMAANPTHQSFLQYDRALSHKRLHSGGARK